MPDELTNDHWSLTLKRESVQWYCDFKEYWTLQYDESVVTYKLRVTGPNGEACREETIDRGRVPDDVREAFGDLFEEAEEKV